jgi:hypothetical protein
MKQKKGLGSIPQGLEWIKPTTEITTQELPEQILVSPVNIPQKSSQKGLGRGWTRATFIVQEELLEQLKILAHWERVTIKDLVSDALKNYLSNKSINANSDKCKCKNS